MTKKGSQSFSLTKDEIADVDRRARVHGFRNRAEYLLALTEAEDYLQLVAVIDPDGRRFLRLSGVSASSGKAEKASSPGAARSPREPDRPGPAKPSR